MNLFIWTYKQIRRDLCPNEYGCHYWIVMQIKLVDLSSTLLKSRDIRLISVFIPLRVRIRVIAPILAGLLNCRHLL